MFNFKEWKSLLQEKEIVRIAQKRIPGPYGVFIPLFAEKQLAFEGKLLLHRIPGDQGIEIGLVFSGFGPQDAAQTLGLFLPGAEGARYLNGHGGIGQIHGKIGHLGNGQGADLPP